MKGNIAEHRYLTIEIPKASMHNFSEGAYIKYVRKENHKFRPPLLPVRFKVPPPPPCVHTQFQYWILRPINYAKPKDPQNSNISWKIFNVFWITFRFFKWCINRSQNTKWKPKTWKGSTMNKVSGLPQF